MEYINFDGFYNWKLEICESYNLNPLGFVPIPSLTQNFLIELCKICHSFTIYRLKN